MMSNETDREEQALDWIVRLREPMFDNWETFGDWLAADPRHAETYHAMAAADADMGARLAAPAPAPIIAPARHRSISRRGWMGGAIAASIAALAGYAALTPRPSPYVVETPDGMPRAVMLADGTQIQLNGGTRLRLDRANPRFAALDSGQAVFTVVHDAARPFEVEVAGATLLDLGTIFDVTRDGETTSVKVAEGEVLYNPDREAVRLPAGRTLRAVDGETRLVLGRIDPNEIAVWREGRLVYDGAPLSEVAADLSRNLGFPVVASPAVAARPFRGVISFGKDREAVMTRIAMLLDVRVRRDAKEWVLTETP